MKSTRPRPHAQQSSAQRGMVLVIVMIVVAMVSLAGFSFAELMFTENKAVHLQGDELQAELLAASGVELVKSFVEQPVASREQVGGWLDNPAMFRGVQLSGENRTEPSGHFDVIAPQSRFDPTLGVRFGLENESARLNLAILPRWESKSPGAARRALQQLPGMTSQVADALLDWIDADNQPREQGAEADYYAEQDPPYTPRNGPPESLEELLLVKGVSRELLFGVASTDRGQEAGNAASRSGGRSAFTAGNSGFGPPWSTLLTLSSGERNRSAVGTPRINVNDSNLPRLYQRLCETLEEPWARFVVVYRQYGPQASGHPSKADKSTGSDEGAKHDSSAKLDLTAPAKFTLASLLDLIDVHVRVPASGGRQAVELASPFVAVEGLSDKLPKLMDLATVTNAPVLRGKVNVNLAPAAVLRAVPGIDAALAERIVAARATQGEQDATSRRHATWLLTERLVDVRTMKALLPYVTAGGDVFRAEIYGLLPRSGPVAHVEVVIDGAIVPPRQVYWKDLRPLGRGFPAELLGADSDKNRQASAGR